MILSISLMILEKKKIEYLKKIEKFNQINAFEIFKKNLLRFI